MNTFLGLISSSSSNDDDSDDKLSMEHDMIREITGPLNVERKHRISINCDRITLHKFWYVITLPLIVYTTYQNSNIIFVLREIYSYIWQTIMSFSIEMGARGKFGFTTIQKCTTTIRQLVYDIDADASDKYLKMSERKGREYAYLFISMY
uniref:Uncharacterized protein n=1 Tax=Lactuca sativa TaxID=4236 RepID=A0A9R1VB12_LACSA|nr:hypothetical protein LSAT_V11C500264530 [Lactuca sativa]